MGGFANGANFRDSQSEVMEEFENKDDNFKTEALLTQWPLLVIQHGCDGLMGLANGYKMDVDF